MSDPFVVGVNYWPRNKAMYWWSDFDAGEVRDEFDVIADLGLDVVRIFLLWDDWQPTPVDVPLQRLADLEAVCGAAAERNIGLDVTFFVGHMSGPNWAPRWLLSDNVDHPSPHVRQVISNRSIVGGSYRNMFADPMAIAAQKILLRTVVDSFRDHEGIWMWNLGNEPDLFAHPASAHDGRSWVAEMRAVIRDIDPVHPVTCGLHVASLLEDNGLRVDDVFEQTDVAVMHGYPMYIPWARDPLDADFVPFLCALTSTLAGKRTMAEEWGGCTVPGRSTTWEWTSYGGTRRTQFMAGEEAFAAYVAEVLDKLVDVGSTGAMLWCFADYAEHLWDRPPLDPSGATHERHFGLVRPDGSLKPHAEAVRTFASSRPSIRHDFATLPIDPATYYDDPERNARLAYRKYVGLMTRDS